ncbi:MAG: glycosyltransferase family 4 protein [Candidatus Levyibacteriota bacterium]
MKIGIYDPYLDDLGGGEKYMMTIASSLLDKNEVTVFWDKKEDIAAIETRFTLSLKTIKIAPNIFSNKFSFTTRMNITKNYDVLIILSDGSIPFVFSHKLFLHIQQPLPIKKYSSFKDKIKLKRVSEIFYNSEFTKQYNAPLFPKIKSAVIYPPVFFRKTNTKKENYIMHVGRFRVQNVPTDDFKKQSVMIETFKKMVDQGLKNWKFILAASVKKEDEALFALLQKNAKEYPIEFHINKNNDELFNLYNKSKIYWHASGYGEDLEKHPEFAEHFGISTVEAMGAGVVPVVINAGGQKEIVTDGKNGLLWNTTEELSNRTMQLVNNQKLWSKLSEEAEKRAKDFSVEIFSERIQRLIQS